MTPGRILLTGFIALTAQSATPPTQAGAQQSPCARAVADAAAGEICSGDQAARLATAAAKESTENTRLWELAVEHYRKALLLTSNVATKVVALNLLADAYGTQRLNDPGQVETALREIIDLTPHDLAPVYRLSRFQEDQGLIDAAEETLVGARHQQPDAVEPYRMLAQFYSRRAAAREKETDRRAAITVTLSPNPVISTVCSPNPCQTFNGRLFQWRLTGALTIQESAGIGGNVDSVTVTAFTPPTIYSAAEIVKRSGTNHVPAHGTLIFPLTFFYGLVDNPSAKRQIVLPYVVVFTDDRGNHLTGVGQWTTN
jgi:hypothetical protein